ncbi:MAG: metal ABC transporter substrate-binding protein [Actinobacteria bacterium]|nr:metal ABC transporter substrate-binding protein [Actinomycetota bacterium]
MRIIPKILIGICPALFALSACSSSGTTTAADSDRPTVVVTYSVLGSIVEQLVGDAATVTTLIPDGQDPHEFEPSAKDIESLNNASIVVSNGLDFEEGLEETLENAKTAGVSVFMAGDHVTVRELSDEDNHADEATTDTTVLKEEEHDHEASDPHLWLSPAAMLEMLPELSKAVGAAIGADLSAQLETLVAELTALDSEIQEIIGGIKCELVSGHDEMGYFADRYGCEVIGAIIPSFSTTSEASAGELADLKAEVELHDVKAVFTGLGTSPDVAEQLATELGVKAVTLSTHFLDGAETYREFMLRMVNQIAEALG